MSASGAGDEGPIPKLRAAGAVAGAPAAGKIRECETDSAPDFTPAADSLQLFGIVLDSFSWRASGGPVSRPRVYASGPVFWFLRSPEWPGLAIRIRSARTISVT